MPIPKKRGRKPKGGKIIYNDINSDNKEEEDTNIILHLKCRTSDLEKLTTNYIKPFEKTNKYGEFCEDIEKPVVQESNLKNKTQNLAYNLHNNIINKLSSCFWCTYSFENQPYYIPKNILNKEYQCYGCFCSPECATSFLFKENIESSFKFERYNLLNSLYNENGGNIKPAPDPYYTLEKYYGNLTIEEYRQLLKNDKLLLIIDKPISIILPSLHIENNSMNDNITNDTKFVMRKNSIQKDKKKIVDEHFGL